VGQPAGDVRVRRKYLRKGDRVHVEGEIDYRSYETETGHTRWRTEITAPEVLGGGNAGGERDGERPRSTAGRRQALADACTRSPREL
jgi:single-stranded DNA-binding protein